MSLSLILGGPGAGKTTRLLQIMEQELAAGVHPSQIAFVSFTKAAAGEARQRAMEQFGLTEDDLPWFRTLHSLAYKQLALTKDDVVNEGDWPLISAATGEQFTGAGELLGTKRTGDLVLQLMAYAANTRQTLEQVYHQFNLKTLQWATVRRIASVYEAYKVEEQKLDFNDMLVEFVANGTPLTNVTVAIIDEAQDLTTVQWGVVRRAFAACERMYVGGDDDQAIYFWAGADMRHFLKLSTAPEVLPVSHRLPRNIHHFSQRIVERIGARYTKHFRPTEREGHIGWYSQPHYVDLTADGTWFLLARNNYLLNVLERVVRDHGLNYATRRGPVANQQHVAAMQLWERLRSGKQPDASAKELRSLAAWLELPVPTMRELERYPLTHLAVGERRLAQHWWEALTGIPSEQRSYYHACLRRGESLTKPPRLTIETIHGVKGAEADHVLLLTDISTVAYDQFRREPDSEHRTFYVAATRARQSLHLIRPRTQHHYPMPAK